MAAGLAGTDLTLGPDCGYVDGVDGLLQFDSRTGAGARRSAVDAGDVARGAAVGVRSVEAEAGVRWSLRLVLRVLVASAWAGLLVLAGVWCWSNLSGRLPTAAGLCRVMGLTLVAMGQFVFAAVVADRLCPGASGWLRTPTQVIAGATYLLGLVLLLLMLAGVIRQ